MRHKKVLAIPVFSTIFTDKLDTGLSKRAARNGRTKEKQRVTMKNRQLMNEANGLPVWVGTVRGKLFGNNTGVDWRSAPEKPANFEGYYVSVTWRPATEADLDGKTPAYRHAAVGSADGWSRFRQHYE